jgi:YfiH family protein
MPCAMSEPKLFFRPHIFDNQPSVVAVHSLRVGAQPGAFSLAARGTTEEAAAANREALMKQLGLNPAQLGLVRQVHGDVIYELADDYDFGHRPEADAIITNKSDWLIGVLVADCIGALLYDPKHQAIGAVHSGWRGSATNIVAKTVAAMSERYGSLPDELIAYLSPSPLRFEYGLPLQDTGRFDWKYSSPKSAPDRWFDNKLVVFDQLVAAGLRPEHIEADPQSNFSDRFHSFRRDRDEAGRHLVAIGLKT